MAKVGLYLRGGLGDVLMAMGLANALKAMGHRIILQTRRSHIFLAKQCPYLDQVLSLDEPLPPCDRSLDLSFPIFSISGKHLIDHWLEIFGLRADPKTKEIHLRWPKDAAIEAKPFLRKLSSSKKKVLLHPGGIHPNRTWPKENWEALASLLVNAGCEVIAIGNSRSWNKQSAMSLNIRGVVNTIDRLSFLASGELMKQSDLLVACDSGPIQLAGATKIAIAGIYTVVKGDDRSPYRNGELGWNCHPIHPTSCPLSPCYSKMHDPIIWMPIDKRLSERKMKLRNVFENWCLNPEKFSCLKKLTPQTVAEHCLRILSSCPSEARPQEPELSSLQRRGLRGSPHRGHAWPSPEAEK